MFNQLHAQIDLHFKTEEELVSALGEVKQKITEGYTSNVDRSEGGFYYFNIKHLNLIEENTDFIDASKLFVLIVSKEIGKKYNLHDRFIQDGTVYEVKEKKEREDEVELVTKIVR